MSAIPENVLAHQKAALDALMATQTACLGGFERLVNLNLQVARAALEEGGQRARHLAGAKDPQEAMAYGGGNFGADQAASYGREVLSIAGDVQGELKQIHDAQRLRDKAALDEAVEQWIKAAPAGSESMVAMVRTCLGSAQAAFTPPSAR